MKNSTIAGIIGAIAAIGIIVYFAYKYVVPKSSTTSKCVASQLYLNGACNSVNLTISPEYSTVDVNTPDTITATLRDDYGTPLEGAKVEFLVQSVGTNNVIEQSGEKTYMETTDAEGNASITVKFSSAGEYYVTCKVTGTSVSQFIFLFATTIPSGLQQKVTLYEVGLPAGYTWNIRIFTPQLPISLHGILGNIYSAMAPNPIVFDLPAGNYTYVVDPIFLNSTEVNPNPHEGTFTVASEPVILGTITFNEVYGVSITETGLPSGSTWKVIVYPKGKPSESRTYYSSGDYASFGGSAGSYDYSVPPVSVDGVEYTANPSTGSFTLSSSNYSVGLLLPLVRFSKAQVK